MATDPQYKEFDDLVEQTLQDLGKGDLPNLALNYQNYPAFSRLWKPGRAKKTTGTGIRKNVIYKLPGSVKHQGFEQPVKVTIPQVTAKFSADWCHIEQSWGWFRQEMLMNSGAARINNIIVPRRQTARDEFAEEVEEKFWALPDANNPDVPKGLFYALTFNATQGFNGSYATGFTDKYGESTTKIKKLKNWTDKYADLSKTDGLLRIRKAFQRTTWRPPLNASQMKSDLGQRYAIFTDFDSELRFASIAEGQNDKLGSDVASMDGQVVIKRVPIIAVSYLSEENNPDWGSHPNPILGVDMDTFDLYALTGDFMEETGPRDIPDYPNGRGYYLSATYQYLNELPANSWTMYKG